MGEEARVPSPSRSHLLSLSPPSPFSFPNLAQPSVAHSLNLPSSLRPRVASLSELRLLPSMYLVWQLILAPHDTAWCAWLVNSCMVG